MLKSNFSGQNPEWTCGSNTDRTGLSMWWQTGQRKCDKTPWGSRYLLCFNSIPEVIYSRNVAQWNLLRNYQIYHLSSSGLGIRSQLTTRMCPQACTLHCRDIQHPGGTQIACQSGVSMHYLQTGVITYKTRSADTLAYLSSHLRLSTSMHTTIARQTVTFCTLDAASIVSERAP